MSSLMDKAKEFMANKIAEMPKPEATLTSLKAKEMSLKSITFHSKVSVNNPYSVSIPVCEISYTLKSATRVIASGTMPDPGSLSASSETELDIPVNVPYDFLLSLLKDIGRDWDVDYEMEVGLTIDLPVIGNFTIPLKVNGEIKLPTLSDFFSSKD